MAQSGSVAVAEPRSQWPTVVGVVGIVIGALTVFDKAGDVVAIPFWTQLDWQGLLPPDLAQLIPTLLPPAAWIVATSLVWIALGVLLINGSLRLQRRRRSGVSRLRLWAWLAIGWLAVDWAIMLWWLSSIADELSTVVPAGWQATAAPAMVFILALMLAWPVFLLVWLARPAMSVEHAVWPE